MARAESLPDAPIRPIERRPLPFVRSMIPRWKRPSQEVSSVPPGTRVYAIGDVHGEARLLLRLLQQIARDSALRGPADTMLVFLGDLIDRGTRAAELLRAFAGITDRQVVILKGNHEAALVNAYHGDEAALRFWLAVGGAETLAGFGVALAAAEDDLDRIGAAMRDAVPATLVDWLDGLPTSWSLGDYFFAHAGIRPGVALERQIQHDLLWIREPFLSSRRRHEKVIVHGHTIEAGVPRLGGNRIGIDTGAFELGRLTALGLEEDRQWLLQAADDVVALDGPILAAADVARAA